MKVKALEESSRVRKIGAVWCTKQKKKIAFPIAHFPQLFAVPSGKQISCHNLRLMEKLL